jgi:hypothetical protein
MTRTGKIARLPKGIREQLNRRIENNEPGKILVKWLNSLPEVQSIIKEEFGDRPIREQNLSEWKKRGFQDWCRLQNTREAINHLRESSEVVGSRNDCAAINRHLSLSLVVELARALDELSDESIPPHDRANCLTQLIGRFAQLRREESNAVRAELVREKRDEELEKRRMNKHASGQFMPLRALHLQQMYIELFSQSETKAWLNGSELHGKI